MPQAALQLDPTGLTPAHAHGAYNNANALQRLGQFEQAVAYYDLALKLQPRWPEALANRGVALQALGRLEEALESYDQALAVRPAFALAHSNRGNALCSLGRLQQALMSYEQALLLQPDYPEALQNRGTALHALGRYSEALESFDRVLAIRPDMTDALLGRGSTLTALQRPVEALESCIRALAMRPNHADTLNMLGNALCALNRLDAALAIYEQAIAINSGLAGSFYNRGNVLQALGRHEQSLESYERALALKPGFAEALNNRANALLTLRRNREAAEDFTRVLSIDPDYPYAKGKRLHARLRSCDWAAFEEQAAEIAADIGEGKRSSEPFENIAVSNSIRDQLQCARLWINSNCPSGDTPFWSGESYRHDRIRLAYISGDFHEHAVAYLIAGLIEQHERERFETIAISFGPDSDSAIRSRLRSAFGQFIDVRNKSDLETASLLRQMEVDIAVDLAGLTAGSRPGILALRPAPVQVNYLGFPGTMGAPWIDYILADQQVIPEHLKGAYSEKVVHLPDTFQANDGKRPRPQTAPPRAELGLPDDAFVFSSFSNSYKFTPAMFDVWMRLLGKVNGSVLWILASDPTADQNLRREAESRGIDPQRIVTAPPAPYLDYLARYRRADLFLDTLPFNAGTTASDALWCGLPVVTCSVEAFASRMAGSLLQAAGLPELVTSSLDEYEALALRLTQDPAHLALIKAKLASGSGPLFDTARFTRHIEAAFTTMHERARRGLRPESFAVEPSR
jgi:protein O-GlcNAc transferase